MGGIPTTTTKRPRHTAFVREQIDVDHPLPRVHRRLCQDDDGLARLAQSAIEIAHSHHCEAACDLVMPTTVLLDSGSLHEGSVLVPMRWESDEGYAVLDGNVELRASGPGTCRVQLVASYRQPRGEAGEPHPAAFDEVATCTAGTFLGLLSGRLGDGTPGQRTARRGLPRQA